MECGECGRVIGGDRADLATASIAEYDLVRPAVWVRHPAHATVAAQRVAWSPSVTRERLGHPPPTSGAAALAWPGARSPPPTRNPSTSRSSTSTLPTRCREVFWSTPTRSFTRGRYLM